MNTVVAVTNFLALACGLLWVGCWLGRRRLEAAERRAYIAGLQQGAQAVADAVNAEAGFEKVDLGSVPPSDEVRAEDRRRS